ncbi:MAG: tetratricopeptide repeat protein [Burkholderiales bacterium]
MKELDSFTVLIVEPRSGMRDSMHNMLNLCGISKIDHAVGSGPALRSLKSRAYDIILCEYDLGEGQDGQQLLEDLRHHKLIPLWTIFIMVTAERSYEKVVGAAELAPTDYLLKPFTADAMLERLGRALDRQAPFMSAYQLMHEGNLTAALDACIEGSAKNPRFMSDFMRLRAELHLMLGQAEQAGAIYKKLIEIKAFAWARLGLAKALVMQNRLEEAEALLQSLVLDNPKFLDTYDWLARIQQTLGRLSEAQGVLEKAVEISPHVVRRLRKLGDVAMEAGDMAVAEKTFQKVVAKARYSEFRDPEDHVKLVKTLVKKGDTKQAAIVVRDLEKSLAGIEKIEACRAFSAAMIHEQAGDAERAVEEFSAAVTACRDGVGLSTDLKLNLAKSCLDYDMDDAASEIMVKVMSNATDSVAMGKARKVFEEAGREDLADSVAKESRKQVLDMVSTGVELAKNGDYRGAVQVMTEAALKFPDNPQVVFNAVLALLKCIENFGWDHGMGEQVHRYIETYRRLDPTNPRLIPLSDLYQSVRKQHGVTLSGFHVKSQTPT